jgi:hypothetical protein
MPKKNGDMKEEAAEPRRDDEAGEKSPRGAITRAMKRSKGM